MTKSYERSSQSEQRSLPSIPWWIRRKSNLALIGVVALITILTACGPGTGQKQDPAPLGSIAGRVYFDQSLGREQRQRIYVIAGYCTSDPCYEVDQRLTRETSFVVRDVPTDNQLFIFTNLPAGLYDVWAFRDFDDDGIFDEGELWGEYIDLLQVEGQDFSGIDIVVKR